MTEVVALRTEDAAPPVVRRAPAARPVPAVAPVPDEAAAVAPVAVAEGALELIRKTAETVRQLQQEKEAAERQAYEFFEERKRERAERVSDLATFERKIEAALERVGSAEAQATEAKSQARVAMQLYEEAQAREIAASERAEAAESRAGHAEAALAALEDALVAEFAGLVDGSEG